MDNLAKLISFTLVLSVLSVSAWAEQSTTRTASSISVEKASAWGVDNTEMNVRDKSGATLTPQMQSNRKEDRKLLAAVRRTVVDDNTLSTSGQNVKILARDGVVTLRGPVDNESEKNKLGDLAKQVAGVTSVLNQLDVKTK
ncbi:BON domain-containing protein [Janthinobacterium sp. B9-8]|uniref:BON domain-containing protein n=1 Tax=Janthinobacterium sp. B9-8 TaxID=1236179 RepID=UPI00061CEA6F|nr:BON domain-containing protein [Janthinobacterium sp. B9-8]